MQAFKKLMELWHVADDQAAVLLGMEDPSALRDLLSGASSLRGRDVKDRIAHLFIIHDALAQLFNDDFETERSWLVECKAQLGQRSPLDVMLEGSMANLLLIRQYVEHVSGR